MDLSQTRWKTRNGRTGAPASRGPSNLRGARSNDLTAALSGIGEDGIAGRQPRGARPNLDHTSIGGLRIGL